MQTLDDNTVTIPNNKFLNEITSNGNYGALDMQVSIPFHIGVDQDVTTARRIITEAALTSRYVFLEKPWWWLSVRYYKTATSPFVSH